MQFGRFCFCSLNHSEVAWFTHSHQLRFQPTLLNLGKMSVVVTVCLMCSHVPIHNRSRCSNTVYTESVNVGCILKGSTASAIL